MKMPNKVAGNVSSKDVHMLSDGESQEIVIGAHHLVKRTDAADSWHPAEIALIRDNEKFNEKEYYVNFAHIDRRNDQWVTRNRVGQPCAYPLSHESAVMGGSGARQLTRNQKRRYNEMHNIQHIQTPYSQMSPTTAALEKEHQTMTKVKYIEDIILDGWGMKAWYYSPYPPPFGHAPRLWICPYCLLYFRSEESFGVHKYGCEARQPPGSEIYRKGAHSVFEVDGALEQTYCQCLSLLSKLFLDHKTCCFDTQPFLFYVLCEVTRDGYRPIGYFSKEKHSAEGNNVACIMVLPPYQRSGFGRLLIQLSYELSKLQEVLGSPEKPLSDLGRISYKFHWTYTLLTLLKNSRSDTLSVDQLCRVTSMTQEDVVETLESLNLVKYWRREMMVSPNANKTVEEYLCSPVYKRPKIEVEPSCLRWVPPPPKKAPQQRKK